MSAVAHLLHLTVPHQGNNFRAKLLQPLGLFTLLVAFLVIRQGVFSAVDVSPQVLGYAANIPASEVVRLTNQKRTELGLSTLQTNSSLAKAAEAKGKHMLEHDYWAHVAPDGTEPWAFFKDVGYNYRYAGENLARDFSSPQTAVDAWMASPSHRDNLLSPKYTEIGIAVVEGDLNGADTTLVVQLFGTPSQPNAVATAPLEPAAAAVVQQEPQVLDKQTVEEPVPTEPVPTVTPLSISKLTASITIGILFMLLLIDAVVLWRHRLPRQGGRIIAHISFIGMVAAMILIAKAGEII